MEVSKLVGSYADPRLGKTRFADWAEQVMATRVNLRSSTLASDASVFRSLVLPTFGSRRLATIKPVEVHRWISELIRAGYSPSTIRKGYQLFRLVLEAAVTSDLIGRNPLLIYAVGSSWVHEGPWRQRPSRDTPPRPVLAELPR